MTITNFDPKIWGPKKWDFLETMVRSLPNTIDKDLENKLKTYFITLSYLLPCEKCQDHLRKYIEKTQLSSLDFTNKQNVIVWLHNLHNERLSPNKRTLEQVDTYYNNQYDMTTTNYTDLFYIFIFITLIVYALKRLKVHT